MGELLFASICVDNVYKVHDIREPLSTRVALVNDLSLL